VQITFAVVRAATIECSFGDTDWVIIKGQYSCDGTVIGTGNDVTGISGSHMSGRTNSNVGVLSFLGGFSTQIPRGINAFFPNIKGFQWYDGSIMTVFADDLKQFPNVVVLNLQSNKIVALDGDVFKYTPNIQFLGLNDNLIERTSSNVLNSLSALSTAYFGGNKCINMNAATPAAILSLKQTLASQCSVDQTCSLRCSLNEEVDNLKARITDLEKITREIIASP
jgi:hypothetical protein